MIIRYIRSHEKSRDTKLEAYARLSAEKTEAVLFIAQAGDKVCSKPIKDLRIKAGVIVGHILRGSERIIPSGNDQIQALTMFS